jgi:hypothetical protein
MTVRACSLFVCLLVFFGLFSLIIPSVHAETKVDPNSGLGLVNSFVEEAFESQTHFQYDSEKLEKKGDTYYDSEGGVVFNGQQQNTFYRKARDKLNEEYAGKKKDSHYWSRMELLQQKMAENYELMGTVAALPDSKTYYNGLAQTARENQKTSQAAYEDAYAEETGRKSVTRGCLIATATFGSPQAREVQLVRDYRDGMISRSYAGSRFVAGFNIWYYSFSPAVADYISTHPMVKSVMQVCLIPLLEIILLSQNLATLLSFSPEAAAVSVLIFGAALYGLVYVFPVVLLVLYVTGRNERKIPTLGSMSPVFILWAALLAGMSIGILFSFDLLTVASSFLLVMVTIILTACCVSLVLYGYTRTRRGSASG